MRRPLLALGLGLLTLSLVGCGGDPPTPAKEDVQKGLKEYQDHKKKEWGK